MRIEIDFDAFKDSPLKLSADVSYLDHGGQALVACDKGTIVKLYYVSADQDSKSAKTSAAKEMDVLQFVSGLDLQGIGTPKPLELVNLEKPVPLEFASDPGAAEVWSNKCEVVAALRMTKLDGVNLNPATVMSVPYNNIAIHQNIGEVMAIFHHAAKGREVPFEIYDATKCAGYMRRTLEESFNCMSRAQREWMLGIHQQVSAGHPADRLLQGDFHLRNVLGNRQNAQVTGVVDFGAAKLGCPETDMLLYAHFLEEPYYVNRREAVLRGYTGAGGVLPDASVTAAYNMFNAAQSLMNHEQGGASDTCQLAIYRNAVRHYHQLTGSHPPDGVPEYMPAPHQRHQFGC